MFYRISLLLAFLSSGISFGIADATGADTKIFKCPQPNGPVLYTDIPCSGGTAIDIQLGPVDPAAPARLAHAQAEFDAAAAQRKAEEESAAAREELNRLPLDTESGQAPLADYPDLGYGAVYVPVKRHPHHRGAPPNQPGHSQHDHNGKINTTRS